MSDEAKPNLAVLLDEEVLRLSRQKPSLFKIIVDRYEAAFLRRARRLIGPREEVKDIVVETFTKIYFNAARFAPREGASFKSWVYRILTNTTLTYYQKMKLRAENVENWGEMDLMLDESVYAERSVWRDYIASILVRMPAALARALTLYYLEDKNQAEIATLEGVSLGAIKTRLHRAKKIFKETSIHV